MYNQQCTVNCSIVLDWVMEREEGDKEGKIKGRRYEWERGEDREGSRI